MMPFSLFFPPALKNSVMFNKTCNTDVSNNLKNNKVRNKNILEKKNLFAFGILYFDESKYTFFLALIIFI